MSDSVLLRNVILTEFMRQLVFVGMASNFHNSI